MPNVSVPPTSTSQHGRPVDLHLEHAESSSPELQLAQTGSAGWLGAAKHAIALERFNTGPLNHDDASLLLVLLCFFDTSTILERVLTRGGASCRCWNELGEVDEVPSTDSGLHFRLVEIFSDDARLTAAI